MSEGKMKNSPKQMNEGMNRIALLYLTGIFGCLLMGAIFLDHTSCKGKVQPTTSFDHSSYEAYKEELKKKEEIDACWKIPELFLIEDETQKELIAYGKELIRHTSRYLGPNGSVLKMSNGMNCQNCHLEAGTKFWGNNYGGVASTYPKMRARSGKIEDIQKRVNDCFQRSLNGSALKRDSREMKAIVAYIKFLGQNVQKDSIPEGTGIYKLKYLSRAADPSKGKLVYDAKCASCHGAQGEGVMAANQLEYEYPPLWGDHSYNTGAGLYRLSRLAGYVKYNMPFGASFLKPQMSDAESWDVAAYINSQPRPVMNISADWPNISKKPVDHPFGPFADDFSEQQHKYGPFGPIEKAGKHKK